jgi:hypothetical protein
VRTIALLALLTACSPACGAPPVEDENKPQREGPAVVYVELGETSAALFEAAVAWFGETTGIQQPEVVIGECPDPDFACIRYGGADPWPDNGIEHEICGADPDTWTIVCREPLSVRLTHADALFRHEWAHLWMSPAPGIDGHGHSASTSLMHPSLYAITCQGFNAAELEAICNQWPCSNANDECEE